MPVSLRQALEASADVLQVRVFVRVALLELFEEVFKLLERKHLFLNPLILLLQGIEF